MTPLVILSAGDTQKPLRLRNSDVTTHEYSQRNVPLAQAQHMAARPVARYTNSQVKPLITNHYDRHWLKRGISLSPDQGMTPLDGGSGLALNRSTGKCPTYTPEVLPLQPSTWWRGEVETNIRLVRSGASKLEPERPQELIPKCPSQPMGARKYLGRVAKRLLEVLPRQGAYRAPQHPPCRLPLTGHPPHPHPG